jgi:hypothetical protein
MRFGWKPVRDRCTTAHEYLFHLTKSDRYFYDGEAIKEPYARLWNEKERRLVGACQSG